ncbi:hypothetical protein MLD38_031520 [Melastoma candidum]|uniref:Uncharacterized protein n=1 Tax=Melastoma candidum TaxID=119954 RepID=A0ACB9MPR5_9MYRT|nr:hypothetical protein MLD38_031520 [Melastoma candidum]
MRYKPTHQLVDSCRTAGGTRFWRAYGSGCRWPHEVQVREIAIALEKCKYRFLWSLRRSQPKDKIGLSSDYDVDLLEVYFIFLVFSPVSSTTARMLCPISRTR